MDFTNRFQPPHFHPVGNNNSSGAAEAAPSAAWLAAQLAFDAHAPVRQTAAPVVIVRKARVPVASPAPADRHGRPEQGSMAVKSPRIFRVGMTSPQDSDTVPGEPVPVAPPPDLANLPAPRRRRERPRAQAPGPLLLLYAAKPPGELPISGPVSQRPPSLAQIGHLKLQLAKFDQTIGQAQAASDFKLIDGASAQAWNDFSADLHRIRVLVDRLAGRNTAGRQTAIR